MLHPVHHASVSSAAVGSQQQLRLTPGPVPRPPAVGIAFTVLRGMVARAVTSPLRSGDVTLETADGQPAAAAAAHMWRQLPDRVQCRPPAARCVAGDAKGRRRPPTAVKESDILLLGNVT